MHIKRTFNLVTEVDFDDLKYILATLPHETIKELILHLDTCVSDLEFTKDLRDCFARAVLIEEDPFA